MRILFAGLTFCLLFLCLMLIGQNPVAIFHVSHLASIMIGPLLLLFLQHGRDGFGKTIRYLFKFYFGGGEDQGDGYCVRDMIRYVYVITLFMFIGKLSSDFQYISEHGITDSLNSLESRISSVLNYWLPAILYAEVILRSATKRTLQQQNPTGAKD